MHPTGRVKTAARTTYGHIHSPRVGKHAGGNPNTDAMKPIEKVLAKFPDGKLIGSEYRTLCPAHKDNSPSLDISEGDDGTVLFNCRSHGCTAEAICKAVGLPLSACFPESNEPKPKRDRKEPQRFDTAFAAIDRYEANPKLGKVSARWSYQDANGETVLIVLRWNKPNGGKEIRPVSRTPNGKWIMASLPENRPLYRLPSLKDAAIVHLVEGEKCADVLVTLGYQAATTSAGGSKAVSKTDWATLAGKQVVIFPDHDSPGAAYAKAAAKRVMQLANPATVRIVPLPGLSDGEDIADFVIRRREDGKDPAEIRQELDDLANQIPPLTADAEEVTAEESPWDSDPRPKIIVDAFEEKKVNDQIVLALAKHHSLFQRGNCLMGVSRASEPEASARLRRPAGTPMITPYKAVTVREMMSEAAVFLAWKKVRGELKLVQSKPPECAASQIVSRREWPGVRHLESIIETPTFLADGRILNTPGWDADSGLLYMPSLEFRGVPEYPNKDHAIASANVLLDLVADFPFAAMHHKAAWLAALLTVFARTAIDGPVPLFFFEANLAGTGKSRLCDIIALLWTGRAMSRSTWTDDEDEIRKTLFSLASDGDNLVMWDNIGSEYVFGGPALDNVLTSQRIKGRILGLSRTAEFVWRAVQFGTGNNVVIGGDSERRIILSRLQSQHEKPELRSDFKIANLLPYVLERRAELVGHVLTILRAYFRAGMPLRSQLPTYGSFEEWSDLVRGAVVWTTEADPCDGREELRSANEAKAAIPTIVAGWANLPNGTTCGLTVRDAIPYLTETSLREPCGNYVANPHLDFGLFLASQVRNNQLTTRNLPKLLQRCKGSIANGKMLVKHGEHQGFAVWKVQTLS